jgi:hypothetical protein
MKTMLSKPDARNSMTTQTEWIDFLDQRRGKINSRTGGWIPGRGVFSHGYSLLDDLIGEKTYMQLLVLQATGKLIDAPLAAWVEAIYGCLSWPDPRIWCNQIGALAGSARASVVAATALGALAADSRTYGALPILEGAAFIQQALRQYQGGMTPTQIIAASIPKPGAKPVIVGYKRPIAKGDERIEAMERVGRKLGFTVGAHLALAYEIEQVLRRDYDEGMNINGFGSAFMSDQGFSGEEMYQMFALLVASGVTACYLEAKSAVPESFLPLRCEDIDYQGPEVRSVPER